MASKFPASPLTVAYDAPPDVKQPYNPEDWLEDTPAASYTLELFLSSHIKESEAFCAESDGGKKRLSFCAVRGFIECLQGLMSHSSTDLLKAIDSNRHTTRVASEHRKKTSVLGSILGTARISSPLTFIKSMDDLERHAELCYAEALFEKALLEIIHSGNSLTLVKKSLNMPAIVNIYYYLNEYIKETDSAYTASQSTSSLSSSSTVDELLEDPVIDAHFRSGVYLGMGVYNIVFSLLPPRLAYLGNVFGYKADRGIGLKFLMRAGGWENEDGEPMVGVADEGTRRPICDIVLLIFHLVISSYTLDRDINVATRVLEWNLKRYPNGILFLLGAGRLSMLHAQPRIAISHFQRAIASQSHYRNLHHISLWEVAIARMALWELGDVVRHDEERSNDSGQKAMGGSSACWRILEQEANWSKAIYSYGLAVCLLEDWENDEDPPQGKTKKEERMKEAAELMAHVPRLCQKIVGKSIPFEKFVARKALKFTSQKCRLLLPALEMAYMLNALAHTPRMVVAKRMLPLVQEALGRLAMYASGTWTETSSSNISAVDLGTQVNEGFRLNAYEGGPAEYWDDLCLARFLHGVCLRYIAYPDPDAVLEDKEDLVILQEDAARGAEDSFRAVFEHGPKIHFDHYLVYYAHYEFGRLLTFKHKFEEAKHEFELILSGKHLEVGPSGRKGRYSMENALHMRAQAALKAME